MTGRAAAQLAATLRIRCLHGRAFAGLVLALAACHAHALPTFDEVRAEDYDALVIPGGRAPEYIRLDQNVIAMVQHFAMAHKPIAAICHGAQLLAAAGVLQGRRCSSYPAVGPDVTRSGGEYVDLSVDKAHVDGNLVTAPAWPAHPEWLAKFLKVLGTEIVP